MSIKKRGGTWYVDFRFGNERFRKKSPVNSNVGAKNYESTLRHKLMNGESIDHDFDTEIEKPFKEYAWMWYEKYVQANNKHSEILMKENILRLHLVPYFGTMKLNRIKTFHVEQYKSRKLKKGYSKKTINNQLAVLSKAIKTAGDWFELDPIPKVMLFKVRYEERNALSRQEALDFLNACDGVWYDMANLALQTGLRLGELIALEWRDIDLPQRLLTVKRSIVRGKSGLPKNGKQRIIPLSDNLFRVLSEKKNKNGFLFMTRPDFPLSTNNCSINIRRICDSVGLRRFGWHALRHTFATELAANNAPIITIKELMGHSDIKTTMRYAHLVPSTLREAISTFETENNFGHKLVTTLQNDKNIVDFSEHLNPSLLAKVKQNKSDEDLLVS